MKLFGGLLLFMMCGMALIAQQPQFPTDPKTGRAVAAKYMTPEELRSHIDKATKTLIIDVRDREEFEQETIKGAVNIPLAQLEPRLKDIPRGTTLVFT